MTMMINPTPTTMDPKTIRTKILTSRRKALHGLMVWGSLLLALLLSLAFPSSSFSQTTEVVTGQDTKSITVPGMDKFTGSSGTTQTGNGCVNGVEFCTKGNNGDPGGTYTSPGINLEETLTIDQINRGFTLDSGVDVKSHVSNVNVPSCVSNPQTSPDCKDRFSLTIKLFNSLEVGQNLVHTFAHEVELDFSGGRTFAFTNNVPANDFSSLTSQMFLFGIDAGFGGGSFGPSFSNPTLSATFDLVTLIETEIINVINTTDLIDSNPPPGGETVTDIQVEVNMPSGQQIASLELEIETQLDIPSVELAPPSLSPIAPVAVETTQVADATSEIENATVNESVDLEPAAPEPQSAEATSNDTAAADESTTEEPTAAADAEPEEVEPTETAATEAEPEAEPTETAQAEEASSEENTEEPAAAEKPKKKIVAKAKESKKEKQQKVARKIVKKMGDKGRYDSNNQLTTLVVMTVLGGTRDFFSQGSVLKDASSFYKPTTLPGGSITDNSLGGFMFNSANAEHDALTNMQYK
jgi:hypothetical protein